MTSGRITVLSAWLFLAANLAPAESTSLTLPADLPQLQSQAQITFVALDTQHLALQAADVTQPVAVRIPAGTWLKPGRGEEAPAFVVWKAANLALQPGPGPVNYPIAVVLANLYEWGTPLRSTHWQLVPPNHLLSQARVTAFFQAGNAETNFTWVGAQIGVAAILQNVPLASLSDKKMTAYAITAGSTNAIAFGLYSYNMVRQVRTLFEKVGLHPDDYRLFPENEQELERVLRAYSVTTWNEDLLVPHTDNLFSGLASFSTAPRVRELLLAYVLYHQNEYIAWQAAQFLIRINGLPGTNDELFQQVTTDPHRLVRFAGAGTLVQRQDWRGAPLLAVFGDDEMLISDVETNWTALITRQSGVQRQPQESLLEFWEHAGGWDRLAFDHDVAPLKKAVAKLQALEAAALTARLSNATAVSGRDLAIALMTLSQRFSRAPQMDAWISQTARTNPDPSIRFVALQSLRNLPPADHCDLLTDRLDHDPVAAVRIAAMYAPWSPDPQRRAQFFLHAIQSPDPQVCLGAVRQLDEAAFTPAADPVLTVLAQTGATTDLRIAALSKLVSFGVSNATTLVREAIAITDPSQQDIVVEALQLWAQTQPDAAGLALMKQTATQHPLAAARAAALNDLDAYSRANQPVMDVALECITRDGDKSVQMSALSLALRQLEKAREKDQAAQVVAAGLKSRHSAVRTQAVEIIRERQLSTLEPQVVELAKAEPDMDARTAAYATLQALQSPALFDVLAAWARSANTGARYAAVQELTRQFATDPRTRKLIEPLANDSDGDVRRAAASFLGKPR